ncbi:MAG: hypothetical protein ABH834_08050 [Candidatus Altiarchaeota archaeon]
MIRCSRCDSRRIKSILDGPAVHVICEHCGFLDENHHITPGVGGFAVTLRLLVKAVERGHAEDLPEIGQLVIVEAAYILHTFFTGFFRVLGFKDYDTIAYTPAIMILVLLWTVPGLLAWQLGHGLTGVALGMIGLFVGVSVTLRAVGTHL